MINMKALFSSAAIAFSGKIVTLLFTLMITIFVTRHFNPQNSGIYFFIMSVTMFATIVGRFGIETAALRFISEELALKRLSSAWNLYHYAFIRVLYQSAISFPIVALAAHYGNFELSIELILIVAIFSSLLTMQYFFLEALRGFGGIFYAVLFGGTLFSVFAYLSLVIYQWNVNENITLTGVFFVFLAVSLFNVLTASIVVNKKYKVIYDVNDGKPEAIVKVAVPIGIKSMLGFVLTNGDIWVLSFFVSGEQLALYGVASRLVFLISFALQIVNVVVSPQIAKFKVLDKNKELEEMLRGSAFLPFVVALLFAVVFLFGGEYILSFMFGEYYAEGSLVLVILSLGKLANAYTGSCGYVLLMTGQQNFAMKSAAVTAFFTILASILVVERFGITGIACCFSFGLLIQQGSLLLRARKSVGINTTASLNSFLELLRKW